MHIHCVVTQLSRSTVASLHTGIYQSTLQHALCICTVLSKHYQARYLTDPVKAVSGKAGALLSQRHGEQCLLLSLLGNGFASSLAN